MSQIASFYLLKDGQRQELSNGDCSGVVYMAIWDWCESELDLDVRFPAPQTEDTLDCALLEGELGVIAGLEEHVESAVSRFTDPDLAEEFVRRTGVDALAVSVGNAHGLYQGKPELQFPLLEEIARRCLEPTLSQRVKTAAGGNPLLRAGGKCLHLLRKE